MLTSLRIDDALKKDCEMIFHDLGLTMSSARFVENRDIDSLRRRGQIAEQYFYEMREGNDREWTLDEINAEIAASRLERSKRMKA